MELSSVSSEMKLEEAQTSVAGFDDTSLFILQELPNEIICQKKRSYIFTIHNSFFVS